MTWLAMPAIATITLQFISMRAQASVARKIYRFHNLRRSCTLFCSRHRFESLSLEGAYRIATLQLVMEQATLCA